MVRSPLQKWHTRVTTPSAAPAKNSGFRVIRFPVAADWTGGSWLITSTGHGTPVEKRGSAVAAMVVSRDNS
ncbi:hypothetical protein [Actinosynnema pretiosum]|uniref:Uncharacterized protein n=1 Tax=Actinosynnema pretiosum TaxID=42197 RepID=A0A290Z6S1_9PSEU|nr:hypothetical protein [Actinosynnema pretiosum]ATE54720.1 hypothetical protein CNX65_16730 [Actinosynnema pretiosum]